MGYSLDMIKIAALCTAIATMVLVSTAPSAAARTAHVSVMRTTPFTVRGAGFRAHERVTVTVFAKTTRTKGVTAGARGGFTAAFSAVTIGDCEGYAIRAKGNRGSVAVFKMVPECAQPGPSREPDALFPVDPPPSTTNWSRRPPAAWRRRERPLAFNAAKSPGI